MGVDRLKHAPLRWRDVRSSSLLHRSPPHALCRYGAYLCTDAVSTAPCEAQVAGQLQLPGVPRRPQDVLRSDNCTSPIPWPCSMRSGGLWAAALWWHSEHSATTVCSQWWGSAEGSLDGRECLLSLWHPWYSGPLALTGAAPAAAGDAFEAALKVGPPASSSPASPASHHLASSDAGSPQSVRVCPAATRHSAGWG